VESVPYFFLGEVHYQAAHAMQLHLVERTLHENTAGFLLLLEHPPVITLGRSAKGTHLLADRDRLTQEGVGVYPCERGGDVTYHGPGQLVGYPIINLARRGKDVHLFVRTLEEVLIRFLGRFTVEGFRMPPHTGVWIDPICPRKIAAIGVAVKKWVTYHGFALNLEPNLDHFSFIVPCGITDRDVTSLARETGRSFPPHLRSRMSDAFAQDFASVFAVELRKDQSPFTFDHQEGVT